MLSTLSTMGKKKEAKKEAPEKLLKVAPPPGPTVALFVVIAAVCAQVKPSLAEVESQATVEALGTSPYLPPEILGYIRIGCIAAMLFTRFSWFAFPGHMETLNYLPGTKLKQGKLPIHGLVNMIFFTNWCFMLLIFAYTGMAVTSLASDLMSPMLRTATLIW